MSTGAPIYLVSACESGTEFVAAFRRYADRGGLFVPMAEPIAAGRRGRFAIALRDGGVMIAGEAEVVSSSRAPSPLYGRAGMTLRFVGPDDPSRTVLVELERARLAMKPAPPSVPPRPAELPPAPRPVPPRPGGRVDAATALAECVAIGDVAALEIVQAAAKEPPKAGPRFVVPSIPPIARPAEAAAAPPGPPGSAPVEIEADAELEDDAPELPGPRTTTMPAATATAAPEGTSATDAAEAPAAVEATASSVVSALAWAAASAPGSSLQAEVLLDSISEPTLRTRPPTAPPAPGGEPRPRLPSASDEPTLHTRPPSASGEPTLHTRPPSASGEPTLHTSPPVGSPGTAHSPPDSNGQAAAATPAAATPASATPASATPASATPPTPRPPVIGVPPPALARPPVVEEPTPSGDWTMIPGATGPTIQPRTPPKPRREAAPSGDWAIAIDPESTDGWSKPAPPPPPAPIPTPPPAPTPARPAPTPRAAPAARRSRPEPMPIVASTRPLDSDPQRPISEPSVAEPKVQIDPTLIEPLAALPAELLLAPPDSRPGLAPLAGAPAEAAPGASSSGMRLEPALAPPHASPLGAPPPLAATSPPGPATFPPGVVAVSPPPLPSPPGPLGEHAAASSQRLYPPGVAAPARSPRRTRLIIIAVSAALVLAAAAAVLVVLTSHQPRAEEPAPPPSGAPRTAAVTAPADAAPAPAERALAAAAQADAQTAAPDAPPADADLPPAPAGQCAFDVTSAPAGAEVLSDAGEVLGTTPAHLSLPCDVEVKLTFRKPRYLTADRKYRPTAEGKPLKVALARPTLSIRVSSTPSGATVTVGGKPQGVTPTTIRLPINEASALTLSKEGFASETQRFTPSKTKQSVHVVLKRTPRKPPR